MADPLALGEHRRVVPSASLRGSRLLLLGILVAPLVMAGYVGLTVLFFLPLLGLRKIFRPRFAPAVVRWDGDAPPYSDIVMGGSNGRSKSFGFINVSRARPRSDGAIAGGESMVPSPC